MQETWVWSLGWEDALETGMATTPVFLPGESHGQRSLEGYSPSGCEELDMTYNYRFHLVRVVSGDLSSSEGIRQWFFPHEWAWNSHSKWKTSWPPPCLFSHLLLTSPLSDPSLGWINAFSVLCDVLHEEVVDKTQQGAHGKVPAGMGFGWVGICLLGVRGEGVEIISGLKTQFLGLPLPRGWGLGLIPVIPGWGTEIQLAAWTKKRNKKTPQLRPSRCEQICPPRAHQARFLVPLSTALSLLGQLPEWPLDTQFKLPTVLLVYSLLPQVWRLPEDLQVPDSALPFLGLFNSTSWTNRTESTRKATWSIRTAVHHPPVIRLLFLTKFKPILLMV